MRRHHAVAGLLDHLLGTLEHGDMPEIEQAREILISVHQLPGATVAAPGAGGQASERAEG
jgi:hypothetical protein